MTQMLHSQKRYANLVESFRLGLSCIVPCKESRKWFNENGTGRVEVRKKQI